MFQTTAPTQHRSIRPLPFTSSRRNTSPGPPSPTYSDTTHASAMNFGSNGPAKIITRANLKASMQAYDDLMNTCANYRAALIIMSNATAAFADAMERCSSLKGPSYEAATRLQAASGIHHLIGNHWHVLAETLDKNFERPLRQHLETYRTVANERSAAYESALREKSQIIRQTEVRNMNRKERNLQSFREALTVLQRQVNDLDDLKASHYHEIAEHEEEVWEVVQGKICLVVRSTMDVFDKFTAKSSDPIIEPMLQSVPDPFDSYGPPQSEDQIFSILAPLSIMSNGPSSSPSPLTSTPERDATEALPSSVTKISSWLPSTNNGSIFSSESTEWATVPAPSNSTPPHSVSPSVLSRKNSVPAGQRIAESKLRSVLSVIDESRHRVELESSLDSNPLPPSSSNSNSQPDTVPEETWLFTYGRSPYDDTNGQMTPRHSTLFSSKSPQRPPDTLPDLEAEQQESGEQSNTPIAT